MLNIAVHITSVIWILSFVVVVHALGIALITFSWQLLLISGSIFALCCFLQIVFGLMTSTY
ncbi:hypothetical protein A2673_04090 [Candidatus Kaiserbacteria bacterium RIFCSPHIGHO2_01_FULL_50_13]|uniref:Uncharacterized protein n=1 Tax=Candidatus Kaiserbacteria bacterium RIFCSPLOWO2_01_FULL_50_24 TaxID=1798507 RepID=A0A1F6EN57_9BACT|nr:MAG: hypothetical protein A2673_04090 [Candidatus Kaiserbacteria bacterium RIFCSPHIGHO2_01_FULL_50_13]OGG75080.1 MAG: hypothetical protein A3A34_01835 [Candidatus Kaiserbacteria bacterium RIFCSPLOWO2_01_FULL_50_24]OGG82121.1 MAG: hypothetical protein A3H74_00260 [Candidatus Kaiserbacteria bacterium RIFCSPLOWO2_02_FULL_51_13]